MKKLLIAVVIGAVLVLALATTALADNGPHGNFAADTDACASCHRAHSAQSSDGYLLKFNDEYALCTSCHNGTGAYTNVVDGIYQNATLTVAGAPVSPDYGSQGDKGQGLFGGGFENAAMATIRSTVNAYVPGTYPTPTAITSHHSVDAGVTGTVWGSGTVNAANDTLALECTSCHDPHGKAGKVGGLSTGSPVASYRLLRFIPTGSNGVTISTATAAYFTKAGVDDTTSGGVYVADVTTAGVTNPYWYTINTDVAQDGTIAAYSHRAGTPWWSYINMPGDYASRSYGYKRPAFALSAAGNASGAVSQVACNTPATGVAMDVTTCNTNPSGVTFNNTVPMGKLGDWCSTCHDRYLAGSNGRLTDSGDTVMAFRHATNSAAINGCTSCHVAHGTTAVMDAFAQTQTLNTAASTVANGMTGNSDLLKLDNRALCADCHGYEVGYSSSTLVTP